MDYDASGSVEALPGSRIDTPTSLPAIPAIIDNAEEAENHQEEHEKHWTLHAPPEATYPSKADALEAVHAFTRTKGYELVFGRKNRKNGNGEIYKHYLECKRHKDKNNWRGMPPEQRRRNRASARTKCPMRVIFAAEDPKATAGTWVVRWTDHSNTHNHPADDPSTLPGHRRRMKQYLDECKEAVSTKKR